MAQLVPQSQAEEKLHGHKWCGLLEWQAGSLVDEDLGGDLLVFNRFPQRSHIGPFVMLHFLGDTNMLKNKIPKVSYSIQQLYA